MSKRILIIGGVAGGASAAARARRIDEQAEIVMFEKGPFVSFSNCALPFHLSGIVEEQEDLVLMQPDDFYNDYRIDGNYACVFLIGGAVVPGKYLGAKIGTVPEIIKILSNLKISKTALAR